MKIIKGKASTSRSIDNICTCILYNMIFRYIGEKYKPSNEGFCLEISPEGRTPNGDISSKSPELPGLYFSHIYSRVQ